LAFYVYSVGGTNIIINQSSIKKRMSKNFTYKEQHAVIVKCSSEEEQKQIFEKLKEMGFKDLKVVSV
jgi:hypothetical protein